MAGDIKFGVFDLGHSAEEALTLAAGGAFYGTANRILSKVPGVSALSGIPVVGNAILPIIGGALLHGLTKGKSGKIAQMASKLGKGLVAASVVSIGVNAGDKLVRGTLGRVIPGLAGELGYDEYSSGSDAADFGELVNMGVPEGLRGSADFGYPVDAGIPEGLSGVDFTQSMGGVDFTMSGDHEMGEHELGGVDFTALV